MGFHYFPNIGKYRLGQMAAKAARGEEVTYNRTKEPPHMAKRRKLEAE